MRGSQYTRPQLAGLWGFKGYEAISRGIVTPAKTPFIILFITKEKQSFLFQYEDVFKDGILEIEGETSHAANQRIIQAQRKGDEIHLFYRKRHHMPFTYEGWIYLVAYRLFLDKPSRFRFAIDQQMTLAEDSIATEEETHGIIDDLFTLDEEGQKRLYQHITYERSRKNRAKAIEIHGTSCLVCGFNFNKVYGANFARNFIEVHHVKSIVEQNEVPINPTTDLIPLCSNCHSMVHKKRGKIIPLNELQTLLNARKVLTC